MSLLHLVHSLAKERDLSVAVAHVNHNLRPESPLDRDLVVATAKRYDYDAYVRELVDPRNRSQVDATDAVPWAGNLEAWGRAERYAYFDAIRKELSFDWVLTAHTANDVAETLLMRLLANKETGSILAQDERRRVLRPILLASRAQIDEYASDNQITWREDSSNADLSFTRNRVRHRLMPFLEQEFGASVARSLSERAAALGADDAFLDGLARELAHRIGPIREESPEWLKGASEALERTHEALRWRVVGELFLPVLGYPLGLRRSLPVVTTILSGTGAVDLGGDLHLSASRRGVILSKGGSLR
jgi:tRNA(Ile)-lysidine synthase